MKKAIAVFGLGFGDEGKGATVDKVTRMLDATVVIKANGGCQAQHNVINEENVHFTFSQLGAGSFDFADTHISSYFLFEPLSFEREHNAFTRLTRFASELRITVDPRTLITTQFHWEANKELERSRGKDRHGSTGRGIGMTMEYYLKFPEYSVRYEDLDNLEILREKLHHMAEYFDNKKINIFLLAHRMRNAAKNTTPAKDEDIISKHSLIVFEHSQGVLLDEEAGFAPHNTWSKTTTFNSEEMIAGRDDVDLVRLGCIRSYMTRHGNGPFPTYSKYNHNLQNIKEYHNIEYEWAGPVRRGLYDEVLLRYALAKQGRTDFIALNHADVRASTTVRLDHSDKASSQSQELLEAEPDKRAEIVNRQVQHLRSGQPWDPKWVRASLGVTVGLIGQGPRTDQRYVLEDLFESEHSKVATAGYLGYL